MPIPLTVSVLLVVVLEIVDIARHHVTWADAVLTCFSLALAGVSWRTYLKDMREFRRVQAEGLKALARLRNDSLLNRVRVGAMHVDRPN